MSFDQRINHRNWYKVNKEVTEVIEQPKVVEVVLKEKEIVLEEKEVIVEAPKKKKTKKRKYRK